MRNYIISLFILSIILLEGCSNKESSTPTDIKTIHIDLSKAEKNKDISPMLDTSFFRVVALETRRECLVGEDIKRIFYRNGRIYIWEAQTKGIFMFDDTGKFLNKIQDTGEGPNEYRKIEQVTMTDDHIYIFDDFGGKILYYDLDLNYLGIIPLKEARRQFNITEMFVAGDRLYFVDCLLDTPKPKTGEPHKMSYTNMQGKDLKKLMPYDIKDATSFPFYLTEQNYLDVEGKVHFMNSCLDTIYCATKDTVKAEYVLDFGEKQLPKNLWNGTLKDIFENLEYDKYVLGVKTMVDTPSHIILWFTYGSIPVFDVPAEAKKSAETYRDYINNKCGSNEYTVFINKKTGEIDSFTNGMKIEAFGQYRTKIKYSDREYIMYYNIMSPFSFSNGKAFYIPTPQYPRYNKTLEKTFSSVMPEDNPVIYIFKMKN